MRTLSLILTLLLTTSAANAKSFIVKLKADAELNALIQNKNLTNVKGLGLGFGNFATFEGDLSLEELSEVKANSDVLYIEESQTYEVQPITEKRVQEVINDTQFAKQWGLKNTGRNSGPIWSPGKKGEDINAEKAWSQTRGARDIKIAVIDTGIDWTHPDLKANLLINDAEKNGEAGVDDDGNGYVDDIFGYDFANNDGDPKDGHGHGTHCSGVIGATHNRSGIRGVMGNVKVFGVKFLSDSGRGSTEGAIKSVDYAIKRGANIMSNSWGGGGFSQALKDAIIAANQAGIIFVAAAGNSNANNDTKSTYPANYKVDNVISVGAMTGAGKRASFSNYGAKTVHVFAPGKDILSTVKAGKYQKMSGTSMACPHVAGGLGLLLSSEPNLTPKEARERLMATAVKNGKVDKYTSSGRMDAYRLVKNLTE